jgi:hypothetical protein
MLGCSKKAGAEFGVPGASHGSGESEGEGGAGPEAGISREQVSAEGAPQAEQRESWMSTPKDGGDLFGGAAKPEPKKEPPPDDDKPKIYVGTPPVAHVPCLLASLLACVVPVVVATCFPCFLPSLLPPASKRRLNAKKILSVPSGAEFISLPI